ncbi:MAG: acyl-CoA reductase [Ferruginibacter sp.]|nr:acyl-CoA reductase [Ferruginibacter sp.]
MDLQARVDIMLKLGKYLQDDTPEWLEAQSRAFYHNPWFVPEFTQLAAQSISQQFLSEEALRHWIGHYHINNSISPRMVGIVMAGNIPLVGFHDFIAVFISGHYQRIKLSSKDEVLWKHILSVLDSWHPDFSTRVHIASNLKDCDAYIATGSTNTSRYFETYFAKYPHIIRKGKTSVALLTGKESDADLESLSHDVHRYFGRGCRSVTKLYVPKGYDFVPLLDAFKNYHWFAEHHRYKNNFDYQLALLLLNGQFYMTNGSILLVENDGVVPPVGMLYYSYYSPEATPHLEPNEQIQCVARNGQIPFGQTQLPDLCAYADGVDTMQFLLGL